MERLYLGNIVLVNILWPVMVKLFKLESMEDGAGQKLDKKGTKAMKG